MDVFMDLKEFLNLPTLAQLSVHDSNFRLHLQAFLARQVMTD